MLSITIWQFAISRVYDSRSHPELQYRLLSSQYPEVGPWPITPHANRSALLITDTEDRLIAAAAMLHMVLSDNRRSLDGSAY
ncbi:hypothetical protein HNR64_002270 [Spongiibacter marinus]|jgi:hypothetical protein|nr:hypothetical protein [Spongiibacter marinus]|tara:strand:- start:75 stop:320 length:246 start_codon:yes stop_codon:yes gene_type:complete